jgi:hypothetical protein
VHYVSSEGIMSELDQLKEVLGKLVQTVELLSDETAELVDKYHRPFASEDSLHTIRDRSLALLGASQELRQVAETVLGKNNLPSLVRR